MAIHESTIEYMKSRLSSESVAYGAKETLSFDRTLCVYFRCNLLPF